MTHYTTLVQKCRYTNMLLAEEIEIEFRRVERDSAARFERHVEEVGNFLSELAAVMGIEDHLAEPGGPPIKVEDLCRRIIAKAVLDRDDAEALAPLRSELAKTQLVTRTHQRAVIPEKRYAEVKLTYYGADSLTNSDAMHDALIQAAGNVQPSPAGHAK